MSRSSSLTTLKRWASSNKRLLACAALFYLVQRTNLYVSQGVRNNWSPDKYDFVREIVVVTGGSSGIGEALVRRLAKLGIRVVILDISPPLSDLPDRVTFFKCNITSPEDLRAVAERIRGQIGIPTILVNNAGVVRNAPILSKKMSDVHFTFDVNTFSYFLTTQEFVPGMVEKDHGHIITVSSVASFLSGPNTSDYNMSKAAATSFHESLGIELKHVYKAPRVRTSIVHPGYVKSPLHKDAAFGTEKNPLLQKALLPDDVAHEIEKIIVAGNSQTIIVPPSLSITAGTRGMSEWFLRYLMDKSAVASLL